MTTNPEDFDIPGESILNDEVDDAQAQADEAKRGEDGGAVDESAADQPTESDDSAH